ncbi:hypothetical protein KIN20_016353 [Parelaphostrongylus tenuis]|uniref:Uncharacterized protein n=1 Tax=Parelaphostrongylus tenuis TaxID=148309 RepID=A0AAD5QPP9_PARTN|nr:hypothetical protein KIN20_016353 [Parelaphostrongylus tenuis]
MEADRGNLERFREDIARLDDDIIETSEYMEETERELNRLTEDYNVVEMELQTVAESVSEERARLGDLEELTKAQEEGSGLRSREVRELTVEHDQRSIGDADNVKDERGLHAAVSHLKTLVGVIEAAFVQWKWDIKQLISQSASELETVKQEYNVLCGKLRERQRMESRADRKQRRDWEEWEKALIVEEADLGNDGVDDGDYETILRCWASN